jgi:hypothetical protein
MVLQSITLQLYLKQEETMKPYVAIAASLAALASVQARAAETIEFQMTVSAGAKTCLPNAQALVIVHSFGDFENIEVVATGLAPNTHFDFFIIQAPTAPFGVAWYMGDISTGGGGIGVGNFVGRFSSETFIISPGVEPTVNEFPSPPAFVPEATTGIKTNPIQMYHLGLWFDSAADAAKAGCPATHTPFNGEHNAGIQVLNTSTFPITAGPLIKIP